MDGVENLVLQRLLGALQVLRQLKVRFRRAGAEGLCQVCDIAGRSGFTEGYGYLVRANRAHQVARILQVGLNLLRVDTGDGDGIEEVPCRNLQSGIHDGLGEGGGQAVHALGDVLQALRPVVDGVHRGHIGQKGLGGTNIGGRALAADVLLAGLQRQAVGRAAIGILRDADDAARHLALELIRYRHVGSVWAAEEEGNAKALGRAQDDIGTQVAGAFQKQQGQWVSDHGGQRAAGVQLFNQGRGIENFAFGAGVGDDGTDEVFTHQALAHVHDLYLEVNGAGALSGNGEHLRVQARVQHDAAALLYCAGHQPDRLGGSGSLIQQGSIRDGQPCQGFDHGLEVEQGLQAALGNLRLVGGIRGIPAGILKQAAADDGGGQGVRISLAIEGFKHSVLIGELPQSGLCPVFRECFWQVGKFRSADLGWNGGIDKRLHAVVAHRAEHGGLLGRIRP